MKVLAIVAGRHNGNSEILAKEALLACQEAGAECKLINLFDYHIEMCTGCESCTMQMGEVAQGKGTYKGCVLKDKGRHGQDHQRSPVQRRCDQSPFRPTTWDPAPSI